MQTKMSQVFRLNGLRYYLLIFINIGVGVGKLTTSLNHLSYYEVVEPRHVDQHGRNRRDMSTFTQDDNKHLEETTFIFSGHNRDFKLHIYKNNILISESFAHITQKEDGSYRFDKNVEHCYYHGYLVDRTSSSAAASTCYGLNAAFQDEDGEEFIIEPHPDNKIRNKDNDNNKYILYKHKDVIGKEKVFCGVNHTHDQENDKNNEMDFKHFLVRQSSSVHRRSRRAIDMKYIEIILVLDNKMFKKYGNLSQTQNRGFSIINYVDSTYKSINTRAVLVDMIVWNTANKAKVTTSAGETLGNIGHYAKHTLRAKLKLSFDNVQFITAEKWGSLGGLAGFAIICSYRSSAVTQDHSANAVLVANTVSHEMGHNVGFMHNSWSCTCPTKPCVMEGHTAPWSLCKGFTDCVQNEYKRRLGTGELSCLLDYPSKLYGKPKCGNGFVEEGEQCDCGSEGECKASKASKCCNATTCELKSSAKCAVGPCCDDCQYKKLGSVCRAKVNAECDLEEFCSGDSPQCTKNSYLQDGIPCLNDTAYCHQGTCKTHNEQCELLWGAVAMRAEDVCFKDNAEGNSYGSCGLDAKGNYMKCAEKDLQCGKIMCKPKDPSKPLPTYPVIGKNRGWSESYYKVNGKWVTCKVGSTNLPPDMADPTIALDGIKCANNSICISTKCVNISSLSYIKKCAKPCLNGGRCNSNGNCDCLVGYAPPYCQFPGKGGSVDSGNNVPPASSSSKGGGGLSTVAVAMLVLFLVVAPVVGVVTVFILFKKGVVFANMANNMVNNKVGEQAVNNGGNNGGNRGVDNTGYNKTATGSAPQP